METTAINQSAVIAEEGTTIEKKLVIVGDTECGKTCLLLAFCTDTFQEDYTPTVSDNFVSDITVGSNKFSIWDTAGLEDYDRIRPTSYTDADVILMCFSFEDPYTLTNLDEKWFPEVSRVCPNVPIVVVGNKKDLQNDPETESDLNKIGISGLKFIDGQNFADEIRAEGYVVCSAKNKEGVFEVFETAARVALQTRKPTTKTTKRCKFM